MLKAGALLLIQSMRFDWTPEIRARLAGLRLEATREAEIIEELSQHLEDRFEELCSTGTAEEEARRLVLEDLNSGNCLPRNLGRIERQAGPEPVVLGEGRGILLRLVWRDLRYATRMLWKNPGFTAVALVTLALCVGVNLTIFAVVDAILVRPLPFPDARQLVTIFNSYPKAGVKRGGASFANYYNRRGKLSAFPHVSAFVIGTAIVGEVGSTEARDILRVSPDFFRTLMVSPAVGRTFTEEEMLPQTDHVAVLTDAYWRQRFEGDARVLGRKIQVNGVPKIIIGVLPAGFSFLSAEACMLVPLSSDVGQRQVDRLHELDCQMIARLKPGVSLAEAQAEINVHNAAQAENDPIAKLVADAGFHTIVAPLHAEHVKAIRPTVLLLQAGALVLLLIGGVNLVNLLLIRASGRTKELAIRQAVGASRRNVVSQAIAETVLLTLVGGLCGVGVGATGIRLLSVFGADQLPLGAHIAFGGKLVWVPCWERSPWAS